MLIKLKFYYLTLACIFAYSKTIRSKIYTNENGTKELVFGDSSEVEQQEIDFLLENLNVMNVTGEKVKVRGPGPEAEEPERKAEDQKELNESILMKHWNSLTEVGWKNFTRPVKKMLLNDTRIMMLEPGLEERAEECENEGPKSVETAERKPRTEAEEPSATAFDLCRAVIDLCQMGRPQTDRQALLACLTSKNETLLHALEELWEETGNTSVCLPEESEPQNATESSDPSTGAPESSRTFLRPRRLLHKVLLPLLVVMVIKYLVTLPFVAVSVFTLNAMWLGLLSLGAVVFAKLKNHEYYYPKFPNRRLNSVPGGEVYDVGPPLSEILWSPVRVPLGQSSVSPQ